MNESNEDLSVTEELAVIRAAHREQIVMEAAEHGIACFERLLQIEAQKR